MPDHDQRMFRDALGAYCTGVTVVTTQTQDGPLGMTVNSFASVSLDPPLVLWSPARKSARFAAFEAASHFVIHVLADDQQALADRFARQGLDFGGLQTRAGPGGAPILEKVAARFDCAHAARYDGGDHLIVVGEVLGFESSARPPLLYHRGQYRVLAAETEPG